MFLLAHRIAFHVGTAEKRATEVPRLSLHRRTAPTSPCSSTYEPSLIVVAQGRKQVDLGATTFVYDESRYLVTSIDLPIVTRVVQASEAEPCLALMLKLEMPLVRELLAREDAALLQPDTASSPALGVRLRATRVTVRQELSVDSAATRLVRYGSKTWRRWQEWVSPPCTTTSEP